MAETVDVGEGEGYGGGDTGLQQLRRIAAGEGPVPPMAETLNYVLAEIDEGRAVFTGTPQHAFLNPQGTVHGGWAATILDSALACAVHSTLSADETCTTVEFKVNLVRPITLRTGEVRCEARLVNRGRRLAVSEATIVDGAGKLLAHGTETCMILRARKPA